MINNEKIEFIVDQLIDITKAGELCWERKTTGFGCKFLNHEFYVDSHFGLIERHHYHYYDIGYYIWIDKRQWHCNKVEELLDILEPYTVKAEDFDAQKLLDKTVDDFKRTIK